MINIKEMLAEIDEMTDAAAFIEKQMEILEAGGSSEEVVMRVKNNLAKLRKQKPGVADSEKDITDGWITAGSTSDKIS